MAAPEGQRPSGAVGALLAAGKAQKLGVRVFDIPRKNAAELAAGSSCAVSRRARALFPFSRAGAGSIERAMGDASPGSCARRPVLRVSPSPSAG
jgi:hypothetical protein